MRECSEVEGRILGLGTISSLNVRFSLSGVPPVPYLICGDSQLVLPCSVKALRTEDPLMNPGSSLSQAGAIYVPSPIASSSFCPPPQIQNH